MTESELSREIKNAAVGGVYFFYGEEDYTKNHRAEAICNLVSGGDASLAAFNVIKLRFDDRGVDMSKISDAMLSPPLMSPMKAVHVHIAFVDAMTEKEKTALVEQVEEYSGDGFSDCVLVITAGSDGFDPGTQKKPSPLLSKLSKYAKCVRFDYQSDAKLAQWMSRHFAEYGLTFEVGVPEMITSICTRSMYRLSGEIKKIAAYAASHGATVVTAEHVSACATRTDEDDAFRLANCITAGDTAGALAALAVKMRRREDPILVLASVTKSLCELAAASAFIADGREKDDFARAMKMHEYKAGLCMRAARMRSPEFFARAVRLAAEADRTLKSSPVGYAAIERLICAATEG
ncbi:MAG: DNA polymerase III subunit delta [Clostridia bacterium]|nr:DNA polymerase III subunit delta [Clostridia bacterium]